MHEKVGKVDVISKPIDEVEENKKSEEYPGEKRASGSLEKREEKVSLRA